MQFLDDSLHPENMDKVVITVAPYGPEWMPQDFPEDIPVTMKEQVQKAVDCYNAGATVLHLHVRELDGKGSKRLSTFNEQCARLARELGREIASGPEAREIYRIGTWYDSAQTTLAANGMVPNRTAGQKDLPLRAAA
ncbi:hypothetical protein CS8_064290 [Cupriavidus sp. 8B]